VLQKSGVYMLLKEHMEKATRSWLETL